MRGRVKDAAYYEPLQQAMQEGGGQPWPASHIARFFSCDSKNVGERMRLGLESGLFHRTQKGRATLYALGPDPHPRHDLGDFSACLCCDGELHLYGLPDQNEDGSWTLNTFQRRALAEVLQGNPDGASEPVGRRVIEATVWTDGELVLWHLPPENDVGAVELTNVERRMLRALLARP